MSIAFVNAQSNISGSSGVNQTYDSGSPGTDGYMLVGLEINVDTTSVTYGGVSGVKLGVAGSRQQLWGVPKPPAGSNNLNVVTSDGAGYGGAISVYSGAPGGVEGSPTQVSGSGSSPTTVSVTTLSDNAWVAGYFRASASNVTASTNTTMRGTASPFMIGDTNAAQTPAGSHSLAVTFGGSVDAIAVSLSPIASASGIASRKTLLGVGI